MKQKMSYRKLRELTSHKGIRLPTGLFHTPSRSIYHDHKCLNIKSRLQRHFVCLSYQLFDFPHVTFDQFLQRCLLEYV